MASPGTPCFRPPIFNLRVMPMFNVPVIETDRVILRATELEDFEDMVAMWALPEMVRYVGGTPQTREQSWMRLLRHIGMWNAMQFGFWAVIDKASGRFIGQAGFHEMKRTVSPSIENTMEAGWGLHPDFQGRGYASEVLRTMLTWAAATHPDKPITCIINPGNTPSIRLAEKHGFREFARSPYQESEVIIFRKV